MNSGFYPVLALFVLFVLAVVAQWLLRVALAWCQARHVACHRSQVPAAFATSVSLAAHHKAADYTAAKARVSVLEASLGAVVLLLWTVCGGLAALHHGLLAALGAGLGQQLALLAAFAALSALLDLPLALYQTFGLEQRFGFNQMGWRLWLADALKSALLGAAIGLPLAALILHLMASNAGLWWLWAWGAWTALNLLLMWVFPRFIAPLFNQFVPLADEALKARVAALMQRCGFAARGLFVMDGSRRSAHANAYFTGFGNTKRVVLFDTLLKQLNVDEVEAVLAHELGHFKHRHIAKRMLALFATSLAGFALLGYLARQPWFYWGLGVEPALLWPQDGSAAQLAPGHEALALLLFLLAAPVFGFFAGPLFSWLSRRAEFEADAWAVRHSSGAHLASALVKLSRDNAATLTPDPWYVRFYYSHPDTLHRVRRIQALSSA